MSDATFYLGKFSDDQQPVRYDPADLTTHAVMIGMTGSGKTGLLIALLEEAARQGLPAIILDPKGDLTNLLLHFPQLRPQDFSPWIDPEAARRAGMTPDALAAATAERWRKGLADWNLGPADLERLGSAVDYTIYTPGSTAGVPVNLLSSFEAPVRASSDLEADRERIASTVTALLGLIGETDIDPLRSREHILLSNILETAWAQGESLDLTALIEQVQAPPFQKLGAFPLERFFPEKDRFDLALLLNNFLAAPSFQTWLEGEPLEVERLLFTPAGQPRFAVFYLAHLSETERMFFVTLLLAAVEGWMRDQRGSSGLRALLAFDEIVGYLPPVANPPSRPVLLRLLKQARAYGLGLALATQNPSDLAYKALSNAGTWFIGRLQTEQDKNHLLDGLQSLDTGIDRAAFDQMIARLGPRLFLMHNVHQPGPRIFQTRWDLNYLAGPLTRVQLPLLKPATTELAKQVAVAPATPVAPATTVAPTPVPPAPELAKQVAVAPGTTVPPATTVAPTPVAPTTVPPVPNGTSACFLTVTVSASRALAAYGVLRGPLENLGLVYKPALLAQAQARFANRRYNIDTSSDVTCLVPELAAGRPDWSAHARAALPAASLNAAPAAGARFQPLPDGLINTRNLTALQKDFMEWVYRSAALTVRANDALRVYAGPEVAEEAFRRMLENALREGMQAEVDRTAAGYDQKLEALRRKIERQQRIIDKRGNEVDRRNDEKSAAYFDLVAGVFTGRKRSLTTSISKRRLSQQAQDDLGVAKKAEADLRAEWQSLAAERQAALQRIQDGWNEKATQTQRLTLTPLKKDVLLTRIAVAWLPYYQFKNPDGVIELAAFV